MLRKRARSHQKEHHITDSYFHSDVLGQRHKNNSFFNVPGLFVGFNPKSSESDSVRSPTSPLDFRVFSSFGNPFRSPKSLHEAHQKSWDSSKVGLGIIDSLDDDEGKQSGKILRSSDSKNILFGPQMRIKSMNFQGCVGSSDAPKSLPKNVAIFPSTQPKPSNLHKGNSDVVFGIGEAPFDEHAQLGSFRSFSLDSGKSGLHLAKFANRKSILGSRASGSENAINPLPIEAGIIRQGDSALESPIPIPAPFGSGTGFIGSIPAEEIELSEDYTCVRTHGPNPKVTHIFGDCILERHNNESTHFFKKSADKEAIVSEAADCPNMLPNALPSYPTNDFLKFCHFCKKKLDGEDIYMYRGEKAFCSGSCRSQEILIDEEMEKTDDNNPSRNSDESNGFKEVPGTSLFLAT